MSHTPTPYALKFYLNGNDQMHGQRWIADATTGAVVAKEDVLAMCNAHDELVAALTDVLARWTTDQTPIDPFPTPASNWDAIQRARAALAKVTLV